MSASFRRSTGATEPWIVGWAVFLTSLAPVTAAPFILQGPGVRPEDFRVTTFDTGLGYPVGMASLPDGSVLVAVNAGANFFGSVGSLLRLVDTDGDGVADGPGTTLYSGLAGGLTSVRIGGRLVFVTGQGPGKPITVLRMGATPAAPLSWVGSLTIQYPSGGWLHPHSALGLRPTPSETNRFELFFQLGSRANFATTTATATLGNTNIPGGSGTLLGDSIYRLSLTLSDAPNPLTASGLTRIAGGLRNPVGFAFERDTGDFYFADNGIDGLVDANEPTSADELNRIAAADLGQSVPDFGFPSSYTQYRTGKRIGSGTGTGKVEPVIAFQPLPDPLTGSESEGPNDVVFAPPGFPDGLNRGVFVAFHGKFSQGGRANEENPLVYADPATGGYFHFIGNDEPGVGHLDGLLATTDSLFIADLSPSGGLSANANAGVLYQIASLVPPRVSARTLPEGLELRWSFGTLQVAEVPGAKWRDLAGTTSPALITTSSRTGFYRVRR